MQQLLIYKSSAGSGKTHTLVREYLKLILPAPHRYREVLAITFTNKATAEMKNRIVQTLSALATLPEAELVRYPMYQDLVSHFTAGDHPYYLPRQARAALHAILNDYGSFSVSTIERFFQRIVRAFARELNIPLGYEVEMNQQLVLQRVMDLLFQDIGADPDTTRLLSEYAERNLQAGKSWKLEREITSLGRELFKEAYLARQQPDEGHLVDELFGLDKILREIGQQFEREVTRIAQEACGLIEAAGLGVDDFVYGKSGPAGYFYALLKEVDKEPGPRFCDAREPNKWVAKKGASTQALALAPQLISLREAYLSYRDRENPRYQTSLLIRQHLYSTGALRLLAYWLEVYRRDTQRLIISDTSPLLKQVITHDHDPPFIYEKIGTRYQHYLLDEFQDTSDVQWANLRPLILEALAGGSGSLIVGDVKQSIYRWRNGNLRLLLNQVENDLREIGQVPSTSTLDKNYRTAGDIVRFNNAFFKAAAGLLNSQAQAPGKLIEKAYEDVEQQAHRNQLPGYVSLEGLPDDDTPAYQPEADDGAEPDTGWKAAARARTLDIIRRARADGFRGQDITLLVRTNPDGVDIAAYLQAQGERVVSGESLKIISHPDVQALLSFLRYLHQPEDAIHQTAAWYQYLRLMHPEALDHTGWTSAGTGAFPLQTHLAHLNRLSVYECVEQLLQLFPAISQPHAYLQGFLDLVLRYNGARDASIAGFLQEWDESLADRSIAAAPDPDAVQVMTIHKSKGLEFPVVILPFADWPLQPARDHILWVKTDKPPFDQWGEFPVTYSKKLAASFFEAEYQAESRDTYLDNLNLLYVAFTRPEYRLYILYREQPPSKNETNSSPARVSDLLQKLLTDPASPLPLTRRGDYTWTTGEEADREALTRAGARDHAHTGVSQTLHPNLRRPGPWEHAARIRLNERRYPDPAWLQPEAARAWGTLVHEALALVNTHDDIPAALTTLLQQGVIREAQLEPLQAVLTEVISLPDVAAWYDGSWTAYRERAILVRPGLTLRPDRVMVRGQEAIVVEYKTGHPSPDHADQVQQYLSLMSQLGYTQVQGYVYYLNTRQLVPVTRP
ncbi:MAG: UvrD-helicase domain-containing protein [Bacteroidia bacterium]|nr:UvrD-helicase domain-containing protein [Bacteroidia bacterium]